MISHFFVFKGTATLSNACSRLKTVLGNKVVPPLSYKESLDGGKFEIIGSSLIAHFMYHQSKQSSFRYQNSQLTPASRASHGTNPVIGPTNCDRRIAASEGISSAVQIPQWNASLKRECDPYQPYLHDPPTVKRSVDTHTQISHGRQFSGSMVDRSLESEGQHRSYFILHLNAY